MWSCASRSLGNKEGMVIPNAAFFIAAEGPQSQPSPSVSLIQYESIPDP
jgi:hypothetical protein